ncbi:hypothetical protein BC826DRAFT_1180374 [Russula brevipes]|nr:hypothetical protein BC826DRAFT_1180374 [Russula brevipes]
MAGLLEGAETADCCVRNSLGVHMAEEDSTPPQPYIHVKVERGTNGTAGAVYDHREQRHSVVAGRQAEQRLVKGTINPYNKLIPTVFQDRLTSALTGTALERHLPSHTFLLQHAFATTIDATLRAKLPNALRHFETIVNQPNLTSIFGSTAFADQYTHTPKEKKKAPAAPAEPKAEKKPKKEEVDDDDDHKPYEEAPKEKTPLDLLPKSTLNLEDWKRHTPIKMRAALTGRSSGSTRGYFGVDFKYNEESPGDVHVLESDWWSFNRLEASRKYLFGSVGVLGTTNNSIITDALIPRRQQEIRSVVEVAPDWEGYTYELIDSTRSERRSSRLRLRGTLKFSWGQVDRREESYWFDVVICPPLDATGI